MEKHISLEESRRFWYLEPLQRLRFSDPESQEVVEGIHQRCGSRRNRKGIVNKEIQVYDGITRFGAYKPDEKWQNSLGVEYKNSQPVHNL